MSQLNSRHMFITNDRLHRVLFLFCRKTTATSFLPLCFSSYVLSRTPSQWKHPSYWVLFQSPAFFRGRKMWRGRLILTLPKQLYAWYNLMQISAMARSHGKKSAHPTFSPVTRKAFQDTYNIVRPQLLWRNYLCQTKPKVKNLLHTKGGKKTLPKMPGIPL